MTKNTDLTNTELTNTELTRWGPVTGEPATATRPVRLAPMQVPKASDVLANDLRERILSGEFPEGTSLPPERDMVVQTQMSRTTVREALRILEVQGLVRIRTGRSRRLRAAPGRRLGRGLGEPADPRTPDPFGICF